MAQPTRQRKSNLRKYDQAFAGLGKEQQRGILAILRAFLFSENAKRSRKVRAQGSKQFGK